MASFLKNITLISQSATLYRDEQFESIGLGGYQAKYLLAVASEEGISQDGLSKRLFVNKSNVARQVSALEEAGYLRREQSESDKRVMLVYLTNKGRAAVPFVREANARWREIVCKGLSDTERNELARLLEILVANARDYMEGQ